MGGRALVLQGSGAGYSNSVSIGDCVRNTPRLHVPSVGLLRLNTSIGETFDMVAANFGLLVPVNYEQYKHTHPGNVRIVYSNLERLTNWVFVEPSYGMRKHAVLQFFNLAMRTAKPFF